MLLAERAVCARSPIRQAYERDIVGLPPSASVLLKIKFMHKSCGRLFEYVSFVFVAAGGEKILVPAFLRTRAEWRELREKFDTCIDQSAVSALWAAVDGGMQLH